MAGLSQGAVIVIVIAASLAVVSLCAAISHYLIPSANTNQRFHFSHEQRRYMWTIRMQNLKAIQREQRDRN
jgi:lipopolysaccharide export LptBFGC system permease protein LptF